VRSCHQRAIPSGWSVHSPRVPPAIPLGQKRETGDRKARGHSDSFDRSRSSSSRVTRTTQLLATVPQPAQPVPAVLDPTPSGKVVGALTCPPHDHTCIMQGPTAAPVRSTSGSGRARSLHCWGFLPIEWVVVVVAGHQ
jgi:hypothetical protein